MVYEFRVNTTDKGLHQSSDAARHVNQTAHQFLDGLHNW